MVASASSSNDIRILLDGQKITSAQAGQSVQGDGSVRVENETMYHLVSTEEYEVHELTIEIPESGLQAYTFTFG